MVASLNLAVVEVTHDLHGQILDGEGEAAEVNSWGRIKE
jgi:hypothetical protein